MMFNVKADVVLGLNHGDEGKGKVTNSLVKQKDYTHVVRFNGGANAGHTIYHKGQKVVTHAVPSGVLHGVRSVIGPGCVISPKLLLEEIADIESAGVSTEGLIKIARNAHIVTDAHLEEELKESRIGTTKRGIGPAYRDKYARVGTLAETVPELKEFIVDMQEEFYSSDKPLRVLAEGGQGFALDIDHGEYPYVTSSSCTVGGFIANGFPPQSINHVYGVIKAYATYVGSNTSFEGSDPIFAKIREAGGEFGATTGRPRMVNFLDMDLTRKAILFNGVDRLIVNKMDILQQVETWRVKEGGQVVNLLSEEKFKEYLTKAFPNTQIMFSYSPKDI